MDDLRRILLLKEQDEVNSWARLVAQTYFAWFIFLITVNATAMALAFSSNTLLVDNIRMWRFVCLILLAWNTTATASILGVRKYIVSVDKRLKEIYRNLYKEGGIDWQPPRKLFLVPLMIRWVVFEINAFSTLLLIIFWTYMTIFPPHRRP